MNFVDRLKKKNIIAKPGFNRWLVPPASIAIHLCIGSVYAWSMFNPALVKVLGVAASSGDDWNLSQVVWIFSVAIVLVRPRCRLVNVLPQDNNFPSCHGSIWRRLQVF